MQVLKLLTTIKYHLIGILTYPITRRRNRIIKEVLANLTLIFLD